MPAAMEGIAPTTTEDGLPVVDGQAPAPAEPEVAATETLYIQNLNERIKVPSACASCRSLDHVLTWR
jgi:hypothetical protein